MQIKIELKSRQFRNLLVAALLTSVAAAPLIGQTLGLSQSFVSPQDQAEKQSAVMLETESVKESVPEKSYELLPVEMIYAEKGLLNRQRSETAAAAKADAEAETEEVVQTAEIPDAELAEKAEPDYPEDFELVVFEPVSIQDMLPEQMPAWELVDYPLYIEVNALNLRSVPQLDSDVITKINMAEKVQCIAESDDWLQVKYGDAEGFIAQGYASRNLVFRPVDETRYVSASSLNMRLSASTDAEVVIKLSNLQKITRTGVADGWSRVKTADGKEGYVVSEYLTTQGPVVVASRSSSTASSSSSADAPANKSGSRIVDIAYKALGVPYVYAGSSMSGMDCSGFTSWVYRQIGITIPRSSSAYSSVGTGVSYANARPGDILAMDTRRSSDGRLVISHVGIYIGSGKFIHASSSRRKIIVADVSSILNWGAKLVTVRRISG